MLSLPMPAPTVRNSSLTTASKQERNPITQQPVQGIPKSIDIVSVDEAAKHFHICRQTIYNMEAAGTIIILHLTSRLSFTAGATYLLYSTISAPLKSRHCQYPDDELRGI